MIIQQKHPVDQLGFAVLHHVITLDPRISDGAYRLYALYLMYAQQDSQCWPSVETLAEQLGLSEPTIKRRNEELESAGYIERVRRSSTSSMTYVLTVQQSDELYARAVAILEQRQIKNDPKREIKNDLKQGSNMSPKEEPRKKNQEGEPLGEPTFRPEEDGEYERVPLDADGEEIGSRASRRPKWSQPDTQFQRDLLSAGGAGNAKWFARGQKSKVVMMEKALTAASYLSGALLYSKCLEAAQACGEEGVPTVMPASWFTWRYNQARDKHWSVDGLIRALLNMQGLITHCQVNLRQAEGGKQGGSRKSTAETERDSARDADIAQWLRGIEEGEEDGAEPGDQA